MSDSLRISCRSDRELAGAVATLKRSLEGVLNGSTPRPKAFNLQPEVEYALVQLGLSSSSHRFRDQKLLNVKDIKACSGPELSKATQVPLGSANELLRQLDALVEGHRRLQGTSHTSLAGQAANTKYTVVPVDEGGSSTLSLPPRSTIRGSTESFQGFGEAAEDFDEDDRMSRPLPPVPGE
jgi:hypothetical protein